MISKLLRMKHPIVKMSLFSTETFVLEFHPKIQEITQTELYMDLHWLVLYKFCDFTKRVINTDID